MSREYDLCEDRDDNGELPNHVYVPSLQLSRKRPRDTHHRYENGPGNNTATGSAEIVVDLELADEVEVSTHEKRRGVRVTTAWEDRLSELADYRKIHGHCNVPRNHIGNVKLATWVSTQRSNYRLHRQGRRSHLTTFRIQELESLGFEWNPSIRIYVTTWEDRLSELADYHKTHGHCNVPDSYCGDTKLGVWVARQRGTYRLYREGKTSPMTPLRIQKLESLDFEWSRACFTAWEDRLSELADYRKIHGHCNVPQSYSENTKLGNWVKTQRYQYRLHLKGKRSPIMTRSRIQALESLGFEWKSSISRGKGKPKKPSLDGDATRVRERAVDAPEHVQTTAHTQEDLSAREIRSNQNDVAFEPEEHDWNGEVYLGYIPCRTEEI
jgi:hypothetical protein